MNQYIVKKIVGQFPVGATVYESDFSEGRAEELLSRGVLESIGVHNARSTNSESIDVLKKNIELLSSEIDKLRLSSDSAEAVASLSEKDAEIQSLKGDIIRLQAANSMLSNEVVSLADYRNAMDKIAQLEGQLKSVTTTNPASDVAESAGDTPTETTNEQIDKSKK